jgi:hypothetical protein
MEALRSSLVSAIAVTLVTLAGCAVEPATPDASFTLHASGSAPPGAAGAKSPLGVPGGPTGDPSSLSIGVYSLYLGASADCSDLVLQETYGPGGSVADLMANPVLFSASPPDGKYACMALEMSDVIHVVPASTFGACEAGRDYAGEIYHAGETDWVDVDGQGIIGQGDDTTPVADKVALFITTDPHANIARGASAHQTIALGAQLVVPGQVTFYWDATGSVDASASDCGVQPGHPTFE